MAWCGAACTAEEAAGLCDGNRKGKLLLVRLKQCLKGKQNAKLLKKTSEILT